MGQHVSGSDGPCVCVRKVPCVGASGSGPSLGPRFPTGADQQLRWCSIPPESGPAHWPSPVRCPQKRFGTGERPKGTKLVPFAALGGVFGPHSSVRAPKPRVGRVMGSGVHVAVLPSPTSGGSPTPESSPTVHQVRFWGFGPCFFSTLGRWTLVGSVDHQLGPN